LYVSYAGVLLFMVLAGALIGSEFSYSTLRLSFSRGVGRGQLLAAQVVALAVMALLLASLALLQGLITGLIGWALIGAPSHALTVAGMLEVLLYWLAMAFNIFVYALVAVCIGTLSRSVAGAIAGPLVYLVIEVIVSDILGGFEFWTSNSPVLRAIGEIPKYLLGNNTNALIQYAGANPYPFDNGQPLVDATHAFVVSAVYCVVLIVLSYLALRTRDIVE
jgi:ABC-type transport system involved in multi-copper enzyme maturation permease subunit